MQTFLPFKSFAASAAVLDNKRLGKQRVEAKQILIALGVDVGEHRGNVMSHWRNHPAVKMWRGHESALASYSLTVCREWIRRGFNDTLSPQFEEVLSTLSLCDPPDWLGSEPVHASHRSNLLRKLPQHYGRFGWSEPNDLDYVWPTHSHTVAA